MALATACGIASQPAARPARSDAPVTVEIWTIPSQPEFQEYWDSKLIPAFKERFPRATIELSWPGWDELETKLITANVGGAMPLLFRQGAVSVPSAADNGLALQLDDRVKQWGQRKDFFDGTWETVTWCGKAWGIPQLTANRLWHYRKDLADEVGVKIPDTWTWEQHADLARQATRGDGEQVIRMGASPVDVNSHEWEIMLRAAGGRLTEGGKPAFHLSEGQWALQTQLDRRNAILPPGRRPPPAPPAGSSDFAAGSTVMTYANMNAVKLVQRLAPDKLQYVTVPLPPLKSTRLTGTNTDWFAIAKTAKAQDVAWELLKEINTPEALTAFNESRFFLPPRKSAVQQASYMQLPFMKRAAEALDRHSVAMALVPSTRLGPSLGDAFRAVFAGAKSPRQALEEAASVWRPILEETKWDD
ncbi:MAG: ABC transporter substrate-binding protein [Chloroflexota bacterium]